MTSSEGEEKATQPPKPLQQRQRAPTISIDDSAITKPADAAASPILDKPAPLPRILTEGLDEPPRLSPTFTASPTDLRPPTSPHNVSSPTNKFVDGPAGHNFLSVP